MKANILALAAVLVFVAGCGPEEQEYTPPKGGAAMGATKTDDLTKTGGTADSTAKKDDKALDLGGHPAAGGLDEPSSTLPDLSTHSSSGNPPDVEFETKGKETPNPSATAPTPINWVPSKANPEVIAQKADKAMLGLTNTLANIPVLAAYGDLKGRIKCQLKLKNSTTYWAQYARFENGGPHAVFEAADGVKRMRTGGATGKRQTESVKNSESLPGAEKLADAWMIDMPRIVLSTWLSGKPVFSSLVKGFQQAGYDIKVESLTIVKDKHTFGQEKLTIELPAAQKATKGSAKTVIVFDRDRGLPVTIQIDTNPVKQAPVKMFWRAEWQFHKEFPSKVFSTTDGTPS